MNREQTWRYRQLELLWLRQQIADEGKPSDFPLALFLFCMTSALPGKAIPRVPRLKETTGGEDSASVAAVVWFSSSLVRPRLPR